VTRKGQPNHHLALSLSKGGPRPPSVLRQAQHGVGRLGRQRQLRHQLWAVSLRLGVLDQHGVGQLRGGHGGRPARIEHQMRDDLADLLLGHAVVDSALEMCLQLLGAIGGDQGRDRDEAAVALGEALPLPEVA
jgi:hypothetical protein